jgi:multidrug efflux pump
VLGRPASAPQLSGVIGGMLTGTVLAVLFVPIFLFVVVRSLFKGSERQRTTTMSHRQGRPGFTDHPTLPRP